jgi:hypothetical protein
MEPDHQPAQRLLTILYLRTRRTNEAGPHFKALGARDDEGAMMKEQS